MNQSWFWEWASWFAGLNTDRVGLCWLPEWLVSSFLLMSLGTAFSGYEFSSYSIITPPDHLAHSWSILLSHLSFFSGEVFNDCPLGSPYLAVSFEFCCVASVKETLQEIRLLSPSWEFFCYPCLWYSPFYKVFVSSPDIFAAIYVPVNLLTSIEPLVLSW